jgi:hypothetical protein
MNKKSLVAPILISIFAFVAVPVSVSAVTQRASEINVCVDWDTKEVKYSKFWEKCPARHTAMTLGSEGPTGPAGADGKDGRDGLNGSGGSGPQGPAGAKGDAGLQGYQGVQGPAGANGANGAPGPAGANGAYGAPGPAGANGANGAPGPAGPTIRSDRDFGTSVHFGLPTHSWGGMEVLTASWNLPANSSGVWSYTVVLEASSFEDMGMGGPNSGQCDLKVKDSSGSVIGASSGTTEWRLADSGLTSYDMMMMDPHPLYWGVGFGTGVVWVDDAAMTDSYKDAATESRDITVEPYFELWCDGNRSGDFTVKATITMVEVSDVNNSITW